MGRPMSLSDNSVERRNINQPGDRQPGLPRAAVLPCAGIIFVLLVVSVSLVGDYSFIFSSEPEAFLHNVRYLYIGVPVTIVPLVYVFKSGKLWAIRLIRTLVRVANAIYGLAIVLAAVSAYLSTEDSWLYFLLVPLPALALAAPLVYLMNTKMARCRWLDPHSLPHEWELPAIHDPNDRAYRGPR